LDLKAKAAHPREGKKSKSFVPQAGKQSLSPGKVWEEENRCTGSLPFPMGQELRRGDGKKWKSQNINNLKT
jgi:hypothetical protein